MIMVEVMVKPPDFSRYDGQRRVSYGGVKKHLMAKSICLLVISYNVFGSLSVYRQYNGYIVPLVAVITELHKSC